MGTSSVTYRLLSMWAFNAEKVVMRKRRRRRLQVTGYAHAIVTRVAGMMAEGVARSTLECEMVVLNDGRVLPDTAELTADASAPDFVVAEDVASKNLEGGQIWLWRW